MGVGHGHFSYVPRADSNLQPGLRLNGQSLLFLSYWYQSLLGHDGGELRKYVEQRSTEVSFSRGTAGVCVYVSPTGGIRRRKMWTGGVEELEAGIVMFIPNF